MKNPKTKPPVIECPHCEVALEDRLENNGFEPPEGPSHYEVTVRFCPLCGITDEEIMTL